MKKQITKLTVTFKIFFVLTLLLVLTNDVKAQSSKVIIEKFNLSSGAVNSLINGIKSENTGLRKSAIFFAGQYKIEKSIDYLIEELKKENDPEVKILIVLSLYKIGNPVAIEHIKDIVENETNPKVKNMYWAISDEYIAGNLLTAAKK